MAEVLRSEGYQTAGIVSAFVLEKKFGYAQGFDLFDDAFPPEGATLVLNSWEGHRVEGGFERRADRTTRRAVEWLERERDPNQPFFLFVHYFDPHEPYLPPGTYAARFAPRSRRVRPLELLVSQYDGEIAFADQEIGKLLDALQRLGLEGETLVVLMGDHGEGLMDHGHLIHAIHIYEEQVLVPLILRWPGRLPAKHVVDAPVELVDLAPTILELVGADGGAEESAWRGKDLSTALLNSGDGLDASRPVYLYRRHYDATQIGAIAVKGEQYGIRLGHWKYIDAREEGTQELFNLTDDPGETKNLAAAEPEKVSELAGRLQAWVRSEWQARAPAEISEEDRARLRALGYID
jgi:arylsulfatase A-like enzyme